MFKMDCQKNTANNIDMTGKQYVKKENSYCLVCRKKIRGVVLLNKIATEISLCAVYTSRKSTSLKQKPKIHR